MDKVTFFEIPADDMKRAEKFFNSVFGWKTENWDEEHSHIKTVETDKNWVPKEKGAINGLLFKRESKNDKPLIAVTVPSISKSLDKAKKAGGKIITDKTSAGEWGSWAEIMDTEGNVIELWEDKE